MVLAPAAPAAIDPRPKGHASLPTTGNRQLTCGGLRRHPGVSSRRFLVGRKCYGLRRKTPYTEVMAVVIAIVLIVLVAALLVFLGYGVTLLGMEPTSTIALLHDYFRDSWASLVTMIMDNKEWAAGIIVGFVAALFMGRLVNFRRD
jgi:hypothetical protein